MSSLTVVGLLINLSLGADAEFLRTANAIMAVESGGDAYAVGDGGRAIGCYQIHRAYWLDAMRILGEDWPYSDARDPVKAMAAVRAYTKHYARVAGVKWNAQNISRIHNGGPLGWKRPATLRYWQRVKAVMQ